jgi:hypothetical protein
MPTSVIYEQHVDVLSVFVAGVAIDDLLLATLSVVITGCRRALVPFIPTAEAPARSFW